MVAPVSTNDLVRAAVERILRCCSPVRIILFGSRARGDHRPDSDLDLMVVLDRVEDHHAAIVDLRRALADLPVAKDIIVADQPQMERRRLVPGAIEGVVDREGRVVFERT